MQIEPVVIDDYKAENFVEEYIIETHNDWYYNFLCDWCSDFDHRDDEDDVIRFDIDSIGFWLYENKYIDTFDISDIAVHGYYCDDPDFDKNIYAIDEYLKFKV